MTRDNESKPASGLAGYLDLRPRNRDYGWGMVRVGRRIVAGILLIAAVGIACTNPAPPPTQVPTPNDIGIRLPASTHWPPPPATPPPCAGVGLDAILHGNPTDQDVTWLEDRASGARIRVSWPDGFRARFDPVLLVIDLTGRVVHREGDVIEGGCVDGDRMLLGYP